MAESTPVPPTVSTFVVRFWWEGMSAGPRWRGRIEHVESGEALAFLDMDAMLGFLQRFGVKADDRGRPAGEVP